MHGSGYVLIESLARTFPLVVGWNPKPASAVILTLVPRNIVKVTYGVIYSQPRSHTSARRVDVEMNRFRRIFSFQKQKLGDD